jgi:hypothetical protein
MGRPTKRKVDYFPHDADASDGRTVTILENHFGSEGYATWFKLLEQVSRTENHIIGCRNPEDMEFLAAKLRLRPDRLTEILDKMASLEAIDRDLWERDRLIWCQKLVDRLADVYQNRRQPLPNKPPVSTPENPVSTVETPISSPESTQSKVKETKVNKTISPPVIPDWIDPATWEAYLEIRKKKRAPSTPHALTLIVKELASLKAEGNEPNDVLNQSVMRGWTGVFSLKGSGGSNGHRRNPITHRCPEHYTEPDSLFAPSDGSNP